MTLVEGKNKLFSLFLSESGNGKTLTMFLLLKAAAKATIIIDSYEQFNGAHKSLKQLQDYFGDYENTEDFFRFKRQILVKLKPKETDAFYTWLMACKFLSGALIVNDEIDLNLGVSRVMESHGYYDFCNRGRHLEFDHMVTARATQNVPKCLTQQADVFYIGRAQNSYMLEFIEKEISIKGLREMAERLPPYEYLKVTKKGGGTIERFKLNPDQMRLFT